MAGDDESRNEQATVVISSDDEVRLSRLVELRLSDAVRSRLYRLSLDGASIVAAIGTALIGWHVGQIATDQVPALPSWKEIAGSALNAAWIVCAMGASVILYHLLGSRRVVRQTTHRLSIDVEDDLKRVASLKKRLGDRAHAD